MNEKNEELETFLDICNEKQFLNVNFVEYEFVTKLFNFIQVKHSLCLEGLNSINMTESFLLSNKLYPQSIKLSESIKDAIGDCKFKPIAKETLTIPVLQSNVIKSETFFKIAGVCSTIMWDSDGMPKITVNNILICYISLSRYLLICDDASELSFKLIEKEENLLFEFVYYDKLSEWISAFCKAVDAVVVDVKSKVDQYPQEKHSWAIPIMWMYFLYFKTFDDDNLKTYLFQQYKYICEELFYETPSTTLPDNLLPNLLRVQKINIILSSRFYVRQQGFFNICLMKEEEHEYLQHIGDRLFKLCAWTDMKHIQIIIKYIIEAVPEVMSLQLMAPLLPIINEMINFLNTIDVKDRPYIRFLKNLEECQSILPQHVQALTYVAVLIGEKLDSSFKGFVKPKVDSSIITVGDAVLRYIQLLDRKGLTELLLNSSPCLNLKARKFLLAKIGVLQKQLKDQRQDLLLKHWLIVRIYSVNTITCSRQELSSKFPQQNQNLVSNNI
ncbi:CLUMA_CG019936, isoform A [Clunio marinus]|uniref:CLUMA_CG019936, isoform A n=1 Tax=Clunio marinus TaxID=568069 RepID=A0A1J1J6Z1_9DIPT|nr:CLUMA_CG019936, isoform A [Clunio marinus]